MARRTPVACGVDVGSTNTKVILLDDTGLVAARVTQPTPRDADGLLIDGAALIAAIEEMIIAACGDVFLLRAVAVAGVGEDGMLVDDRLTPLNGALAWFDPRRRGIFARLHAALDDEVLDAAGDPARTTVGWAWAREQPASRPPLHWLALTDLASASWTGLPFFSETLASRTSAWSCLTRTWSARRVEASLGSTALLPPVRATGEVLGELRSERLSAAGVLDAALVVVGGHDHPVAGWGVDTMLPGVVLDSMGTAEVIVAQADAVTENRPSAIDVAPGILDSGITLLSVEELARNVAWASQDPEVAAHIRALLDGSAAPLPVLEEGHFLPGRRGGGQPSYAVTSPRDPGVRASAVLGALAVAGRDAIDAVRAAGAGRREVRMAGGWARSPGWIEIKTAVNGYRAAPVLEPQVTAASAALLAARAMGWTPDPIRTFGGFTTALFG